MIQRCGSYFMCFASCTVNPSFTCHSLTCMYSYPTMSSQTGLLEERGTKCDAAYFSRRTKYSSFLPKRQGELHYFVCPFISAVMFFKTHSHVSFSNRLLGRKTSHYSNLVRGMQSKRRIEQETWKRKAYLRDAA